MIAALTYALVLFLIVAIAISTRAWILEQLSVFAPLPPTHDQDEAAPPPATNNVITITDWQAAQERRRARQDEEQQASG